MLLLGIILILIGAVVVYFATDRAIHFIGIALAVLGLILILVAVLGDGGLHVHDAAVIARSSWS